MCLLISGCGLFKKTIKKSNTFEQIDKSELRSQINEDVKADIKGEVIVKTFEQNQIQKDIDEQTSVTADEIEIKPDGSIKAKGGVKLDNNKKDKGNVNTNRAIEQNDRYFGHIDAKTENKANQNQESKSEVKNTQSTSEPKNISILYFFIGIAMIVCLVIWWMKRK